MLCPSYASEVLGGSLSWHTYIHDHDLTQCTPTTHLHRDASGKVAHKTLSAEEATKLLNEVSATAQPEGDM